VLTQLSLYTPQVQLGAFLVLAAFAFRGGAGPERASAGAFLLMYLLDYPYHWLVDEAHWHQIDVGHALIDALAACATVFIAYWANRIYTLCLAALQLVSLVSHFARGLESGIAPLAYAVMIIWPSYLMIATLAIGLLKHRRRLRVYGSYRSWRRSSPRWLVIGPLA
jgi:hypothetical protein